MKKPFLIAGCATAAIAAGAGWLAWRASHDLVTLHVQNMPLEKVLSKIRWQTWEDVIAHKDLKGNISIDVDSMPLTEVLDIIGEQVNSRWSAVYPLYSEKKSLVSLHEALAGNIKFSESAFTNWQSRPSFPMGGGRGFADNVQAGNSLVSLQITNKEVDLAAKAISRYSRGQIVPENGTRMRINLELQQESIDGAVAKLAKQAHRKWTRLYALQESGFGPFAGGPGGFNRGGPPRGEGGGGPRPEGFSPERRERTREEMNQITEMLPAEERQRVQENQELRREIQNLTPEQRQQVMQERMNSPEMQARMQQRSASALRNSTPEQRRDRYERMYQRQQARQQGGR